MASAAERFERRLKRCDFDFVVGEWQLHAGYRQVCDFYTQVWKNLRDGRWACSLTQDKDWDGQQEPFLGTYSSYEDLISNVSSLVDWCQNKPDKI